MAATRTSSTRAYGESLKVPFKVWPSSTTADNQLQSELDSDRERDRARRPRTSLDVVGSRAPSRDTRPSSSRAHTMGVETPAHATNRPPSANGYKMQSSPSGRESYTNNGGSSQLQPTSGRTPLTAKMNGVPPTTLPQASTSKTQLENTDHRSYFSKMFSKVRSNSTPAPVQVQPMQAVHEKDRAHKHRSHSVHVAPASYPTSTTSNPPSTVQPVLSMQPGQVEGRQGKAPGRATIYGRTSSVGAYSRGQSSHSSCVTTT